MGGWGIVRSTDSSSVLDADLIFGLLIIGGSFFEKCLHAFLVLLALFGNLLEVGFIIQHQFQVGVNCLVESALG